MKMILTSDLHQMIGKWDDLVNLVRVERPRFVLIAGWTAWNAKGSASICTGVCIGRMAWFSAA